MADLCTGINNNDSLLMGIKNKIFLAKFYKI